MFAYLYFNSVFQKLELKTSSRRISYLVIIETINSMIVWKFMCYNWAEKNMCGTSVSFQLL